MLDHPVLSPLDLPCCPPHPELGQGDTQAACVCAAPMVWWGLSNRLTLARDTRSRRVCPRLLAWPAQQQQSGDPRQEPHRLPAHRKGDHGPSTRSARAALPKEPGKVREVVGATGHHSQSQGRGATGSSVFPSLPLCRAQGKQQHRGQTELVVQRAKEMIAQLTENMQSCQLTGRDSGAGSWRLKGIDSPSTSAICRRDKRLRCEQGLRVQTHSTAASCWGERGWTCSRQPQARAQCTDTSA